MPWSTASWSSVGRVREVLNQAIVDVGQLRLDCHRHGLTSPEGLETRHLNLKTEFAAWKGVRRCGMATALEHLDLPLAGTHHRGIDDARNIATIAQLMLAEGDTAEQRDAVTDHRPARPSLRGHDDDS